MKGKIEQILANKKKKKSTDLKRKRIVLGDISGRGMEVDVNAALKTSSALKL